MLGLRGWERDEVLRLSACLEEHFPHPVARAVVRAAAERGLEHRERHAAVEYIVAHGIASALDGKRVVMGSEHFVVGDEGVELAREDRSRIAVATEGLSPLYLAVDGELVGVIGVRDPLKEGVAAAIGDLRALGFERVIMLTGDNERTAARVAAEAGVTEFRADMLPEDKHGFVARLREEGRHVVMVGDGVNDAPALSLADVGIAMGQGTAIAKEVADITLTGGDLSSLVALRRLGQGLMDRLSGSFGQVMATTRRCSRPASPAWRARRSPRCCTMPRRSRWLCAIPGSTTSRRPCGGIPCSTSDSSRWCRGRCAASSPTWRFNGSPSWRT